MQRATTTIAIVILIGTACPIVADVHVERLRCEYLVDPLGIDVPKPRLSWIVQSDERGQKQSAYHILVASRIELLDRDQADLWDSGRVVSDRTLHVDYAGKPLLSRMQCYWKVRTWDANGNVASWSKPGLWTMGLLRKSDWGCATWIAASKVSSGNCETNEPATMLRREFDVRGPVKKAFASVTGLGLYELRINGQRVGDHILAPEWTGYENRISYQTYDVTSLVRKERNAIGAQLCGGWWKGLIVPGVAQPSAGNSRFCLLMRLDIELADGSTQTVVSDSSWKATVDGPIRSAGIYSGDVHDGTREQQGWDEPGFCAAHWHPVDVLSHPNNCENAKLAAQPNEPIRITNELRPIAMTEPKPGVYVFDLGQNMVGWSRLRATAPKGTKVTVRHAELLNPDGTLYRDNLRNATQADEYTWRGGEATVEPHFTYHGFRYVEVTGLPTRPEKNAVCGCVFHSSSPKAGEISCSNDTITKLMHCIEWTQRGNMMGVPTDCPQRNERLGWAGDIQSFSQAAIFQHDMAGFFTKWMHDVQESQFIDGRFANIAPHPGSKSWLAAAKGEYGPGWSDVGVIVPWRMYENYGDHRMLSEYYESGKRWIDFVHANNPDLIWRKKRGGDWGDWLNGDMAGAWTGLKMPGYPEGISAVSNELFATAFFAHSTRLVAKIAQVLELKDDAAKYAMLSKDVKAAFNRAFVTSDGHVKGETQAGYALALYFELLDESLRPKAAEHLLKAIQRYNQHLSTGIHTTHRLMLTLSDNGHHDEAFRIMNLRTPPSWGYMVDMGATTVWERWDCYIKGRGFQDPSMNSCNHWALGSVGEWVWRELAGIHPDEKQPGYKHFMIRPRPCGDLTWVKGRYDSIRGPIASEWNVSKGHFQLRLEIPTNTTAAVYLPTSNVESIKESGKPTSEATGIQFVCVEEATAIFEVASGRYCFDVDRDGANR
jgi:alpha-L-rhamnosidase